MAGKYTRDLDVAPSIDGSSLLTTSEETTNQLYKTTLNDVSTSFVDVEASNSLKAPSIKGLGGPSFEVQESTGETLSTFELNGISSPKQAASAITLSADYQISNVAWGDIPFDTIRFQKDYTNGWSFNKYANPQGGTYLLNLKYSLETTAPVPAGEAIEFRILQSPNVVIGYYRKVLLGAVGIATSWWGTAISIVAELPNGVNVFFQALNSTPDIKMSSLSERGTEAFIARLS